MQKALSEIDEIAGSLIDFFSERELIVSSYPSMGSRKPRKSFIPIGIPPSRMVATWKSLVWRLWIAGVVKAFALTDHQVPHIPATIYSKPTAKRNCLESMDGVDRVVEGKDRNNSDSTMNAQETSLHSPRRMHGSPTFGKMTNSH